MAQRVGMITPSSNSVLEPVTAAMLANRPDISAHFARLRVTEIALDAPALNQFDPSYMLPAAELLADAKVGSIAWNGTSASWLGIARDEGLCAAIAARTGIPATTSTLACLDAIRLANSRRVGLVTPYTDDVQTRIGEVWSRASAPVHAERHLGIRDNFSFGEIEPADDRRHDPCGGAGRLRCRRYPLHQHERRRRCRSARAGTRCADPRFRDGDVVALAANRRYRCRSSRRLGAALP